MSETHPQPQKGVTPQSSTLSNDEAFNKETISALRRSHDGILDSAHHDGLSIHASDPERRQDGGDLEKQTTNKSGRSTKSKHSLRTKAPSVNDLSSVPNGGLRAWLQVLGAFFLFFNTWGLINTFGVYQTYYLQSILSEWSASDISWIGSIQAFLLMFIGPLCGPIYDAGYFRLLLVVGSFLVCFGLFMLSLATQYWQIFLAQGVCIGVGAGLIFLPSVAILSTYFNSKLASATGIAASGSSLGGIVYPIMLDSLLSEVGFAWANRILGFLALATLLVSNLVMKVRVLPAAKRSIADWEAWTELPYVLFALGGLVSFTGLYAPFFYGEFYAITYHITSVELAFYILAMINAGSVFGRILPNLLADRTGPLNVMAPAAIVSGVLIFCYIPARSEGGLVALSVLYGFTSGALVSLPATVTVSLSTHRRGMIGTRMGMLFCCMSVGVLIGSPAAGWILNASGYTSVWVFSAITMMSGGFLFLAARFAKTGLSNVWTRA